MAGNYLAHGDGSIGRKMNIKIYADGADINDMLDAYDNNLISGFTTNPTLMKKAGVKDYLSFVESVLFKITDLPISFEVFSDDFEEMYTQAKKLSSLGDNVFVKIPVTNTKGESSKELIHRLDSESVKMNITAVFTDQQVNDVLSAISGNMPHIISVFAGRIADTGVDPIPMMSKYLTKIKAHNKNLQLLWASPREVLNVYQAENVGCDIITIVPALLKKLSLGGKSLEDFSRETVKMFYDDALASGFKL